MVEMTEQQDQEPKRKRGRPRKEKAPDTMTVQISNFPAALWRRLDLLRALEAEVNQAPKRPMYELAIEAVESYVNRRHKRLFEKTKPIYE